MCLHVGLFTKQSKSHRIIWFINFCLGVFVQHWRALKWISLFQLRWIMITDQSSQDVIAEKEMRQKNLVALIINFVTNKKRMILADELKWRKLWVLRLEENWESTEFEPMRLRYQLGATTNWATNSTETGGGIKSLLCKEIWPIHFSKSDLVRRATESRLFSFITYTNFDLRNFRLAGRFFFMGHSCFAFLRSYRVCDCNFFQSSRSIPKVIRLRSLWNQR